MRSRRFALAIGTLITVSALGLWLWVGYGTSGRLEVTALDVGQGDAILIRTPHGEDVLIDGGPSPAVLERLAAHLPPSDRTLEFVIVTHTDADHVNGLADVAAHYRIERVLDNGTTTANPAFRRWIDAIGAQRAEHRTVSAGDRYKIDGVWLEVLWPESNDDLADMSRNDTSVVVRMTYGATSFLFTGDISAQVEERMLLRKMVQRTDVLKVAHHGSAYSSSVPFLDAVAPRFALISAGKGNSYGHPHSVVLKRLTTRESVVLRTDEIGDASCISDGERVMCDR